VHDSGTFDAHDQDAGVDANASPQSDAQDEGADANAFPQSDAQGASELDGWDACMAYVEVSQLCYDASSVTPKEPSSPTENDAFCAEFGPPWMIPFYECVIAIVETLDCSIIVNWKPQIMEATAECMPLAEPPDEG